MNEQKQIEIIKKHSSPTLWEEVRDHSQMSIDEEWEQPYTIPQSFDWILDLAEAEPNWRSLKTPARKVAIALGIYVPMTQEEIEMTITTRGTVWDFKLGGVAYQFSRHLV
jgi:hypothetical protein